MSETARFFVWPTRSGKPQEPLHDGPFGYYGIYDVLRQNQWWPDRMGRAIEEACFVRSASGEFLGEKYGLEMLNHYTMYSSLVEAGTFDRPGTEWWSPDEIAQMATTILDLFRSHDPEGKLLFRRMLRRHGYRTDMVPNPNPGRFERFLGFRKQVPVEVYEEWALPPLTLRDYLRKFQEYAEIREDCRQLGIERLTLCSSE